MRSPLPAPGAADTWAAGKALPVWCLHLGGSECCIPSHYAGVAPVDMTSQVVVASAPSWSLTCVRTLHAYAQNAQIHRQGNNVDVFAADAADAAEYTQC